MHLEVSKWVTGVKYEVGDKVFYNGKTWKCKYAHTSQADWYPGAPGIWFWEEQTRSNEWVINKSYDIGDLVSYNGDLWECKFAHTSQVDWYPGAPGVWFWEKM